MHETPLTKGCFFAIMWPLFTFAEEIHHSSSAWTQKEENDERNETG